MLSSLVNRASIAIVAATVGIALIAGTALAWGGRIEGRPASFEAGGTDGYYVWHDDNGLHLRTTDSSGVFEYTGTLRTNGTFTDVELVLAEPDDSVQVFDGGKVIHFQMKTFTGIDGFDFRVDDGSRVVFSLKQNGQPISVANIFLGADSVHPEHNPFAISQ